MGKLLFVPKLVGEFTKETRQVNLKAADASLDLIK